MSNLVLEKLPRKGCVCLCDKFCVEIWVVDFVQSRPSVFSFSMIMEVGVVYGIVRCSYISTYNTNFFFYNCIFNYLKFTFTAPMKEITFFFNFFT